MGFKMWLNKGIETLQDLYKDNVLMSFEELKSKFDIPYPRHISLKRLQMRSFLLVLLNSVQQPPLSKLEALVTKIASVRSLLLGFLTSYLLTTERALIIKDRSGFEIYRKKFHLMNDVESAQKHTSNP